MNPLEMASQYYGEGLNILPSNFPKRLRESSRKKKEAKKREKTQG